MAKQSVKNEIKSSDPDIKGSLPALRRAARRARRLAEKTNTPLFVLVGGRVRNLNPGRKRSSSKGA